MITKETLRTVFGVAVGVVAFGVVGVGLMWLGKELGISVESDNSSYQILSGGLAMVCAIWAGCVAATCRLDAGCGRSGCITFRAWFFALLVLTGQAILVERALPSEHPGWERGLNVIVMLASMIAVGVIANRWWRSALAAESCRKA